MSAVLQDLMIRLDDLSDPRIEAFMQEHLVDMRAVSPPESVHALDMDQLRQPNIAFWSAWLTGADGDMLVGTGALKRLDASTSKVYKSFVIYSRIEMFIYLYTLRII